MSIYKTYCKYLCVAAAAGLLVTGMPSQGNALDAAFSADFAGILDAVDISAGANTGTPVCGDMKGKACSPNGAVQKCQSKKGVRLCQTCTDGQWGSGYHGDCWNSSTSGTQVDGDAVLETF